MSAPATRTPGSRRYVCFFCGHVYDEALGSPEDGIPPGTLWEDVPEEWVCPECASGKADFALEEDD